MIAVHRIDEHTFRCTLDSCPSFVLTRAELQEFVTRADYELREVDMDEWADEQAAKRGISRDVNGEAL